MKITVVSPHRDDAAFSLGLTIEAWMRAGHVVSVLNCFTQSEYAPYSDVSTVHGNDRVSFVSALRRREDIAWNKLLGGRLKFVDLDLLDAPLRLACEVEEVLTVDIRAGDRALTRVAGAIAKLARAGSEVAFVAPLGVGGHIDHRVARQAALNTLREAPVAMAFYEDLPYAAREGEAETLQAQTMALEADLQPVFSEPERSDAEAAVARKRRAADCYDSQIDSEVVSTLAQFALRYGGRERMWCNVAWRAAMNS